MEQFNSIELSFIFAIIPHKHSIGLMSAGKLAWQQEEVQKGDISVALIISGTILYLRALQGHSGRNPIDPTSQDNVLSPSKVVRNKTEGHIRPSWRKLMHHLVRPGHIPIRTSTNSQIQ